MGFPGVLLRLTADEPPDVSVKGAELFLDLKEGAGVADGGVDFKAVADDSGVAEQFADLLLVVAGDFSGIKSVKHFAVPRAFPQDRVPAQARLRTFEGQELEPFLLVVHGHTPFLIVIGNIQLLLRPVTTDSVDLLASGHGLGGLTPAAIFTSSRGPR